MTGPSISLSCELIFELKLYMIFVFQIGLNLRHVASLEVAMIVSYGHLADPLCCTERLCV